MSEAAIAGEYKVRVCDFSAPRGPNVDYLYFKYERGFYANNNCPLDLTIGNEAGSALSSPTVLGDVGGFEGPASPTPLHQVEFEVSGGDTSGLVEYSFTGCMDCEPIAIIEPGEGPDFVSRTVDLGGSKFTSIRAVCVALVCPQVAPLRLRNFKFTAIDDVPPFISKPSVSYGSPWGSKRPIGWVSGSVSTIWAAAGDAGTGLEEAIFKIDGHTVEWFGCSEGSSDFIFTVFELCEVWAYFGESLDIGRMTDGPHTLEVSARDLVGNVAETYTETFYVDNTPPAQPENPRVLNPVGFEGWSNERDLTVGYDNPYMDPRNVYGAGIEKLHFDLEPLTPGSADPVPWTRTSAQQRVEVSLPTEGRWRLWMWVEDRAGAMGNRAHIDLGFDYEKPVAPKLEPSGWLSMEQLMRGHFQKWTPSEQSDQLESGICGYAFSVDDVVGSVPDVALDVPVGVDQAAVSPTVGPGRHFAHLRAVACNGRASDVDTAQLNVDGNPPSVTSFPGSHSNWTTDPTVVTISGADDLSGVARIEYAVGGGPTETVTSSRAYVTMPEGETTVEYQAFDRAGNASAKGLTTTKIDTTAPSV